MEAALRNALLAAPALIALVGGEAAPRIHWSRLPERKALPALILHQVGSGPVQHTQKGRVPTQDHVVQFDCWAGSSVEAIALREALLAVLDDLKTRPLMVFSESFYTDWSPAPGPDPKNASEMFRASLDARVWWFPTAA